MHAPSSAPASAPATPAGLSTARPGRAACWLAGAVAVLCCLAVFGLYTAPEFMRTLADQVWACF